MYHSAPSLVLNIWSMLSSVLRTTPQGGRYYCLHCTDEQAEALRGEVTCPRVHTKPAWHQTWAPLLSHLSQGCIPSSPCSFIQGRSTLISCFSIMARQEQAGDARAGQCGSVFSWLARLIFWSFLLHCFGSKKQGLLRVAFQQAECLVENLFTPCLCFYSPIQPPLLFPLVCKPWALVQKLLAQLSGQKAFSAIYLTTGFEFLLSVCLTV